MYFYGSSGSYPLLDINLICMDLSDSGTLANYRSTSLFFFGR